MLNPAEILTRIWPKSRIQVMHSNVSMIRLNMNRFLNQQHLTTGVKDEIKSNATDSESANDWSACS